MLQSLRNAIRKHSVSREDRLFFALHLALMLRAGISLPKAVTSLAKQTKKKYWGQVLQDVQKKLIEGNSFEVSLNAHKEIFGVAFVSMIKVGELKGDLASVLDTYVELEQKQAVIIQKVRSAMAYPTIVMIAIILLAIGAVMFIFPRIAEIFEEVDTQLPLVTRMVIWISDTLVQYGVFIFSGLIILFIFLGFVFRSPSGKQFLHMLAVRMPILGKIIREQNLASLSRNLGVLLTSGIQISEALLATSQVVTNIHYKRSLTEARTEIMNGNFVHSAFVKYPNLYPDLIIQIISVGEEAGVLDEVLAEMANFYEKRVLATLGTLSTVIEPVLILVLGVGVAFMALAVLLPIYSLTEF